MIAGLMEDFTISQNSFYMIKNFNKLSENIPVYGFYFNLSTYVVEPNFSVMNACYSDHFHGILIASSLETLKFLRALNTGSKKYFYIWDLEWLRGSLNYMENVGLMRQVDLIARSKLHAYYIENYCNKKVSHIMDNWNHKKLVELLEEK